MNPEYTILALKVIVNTKFLAALKTLKLISNTTLRLKLWERTFQVYRKSMQRGVIGAQ